MIKKMIVSITASLLIALFNISFADVNTLQQMPAAQPQVAQPQQPVIVPAPPTITAKSYILIDPNSGKIISGKNIDEKRPPASLTKIMTLYLISKALQANTIHLDDKVLISKAAWKTGGSKMFIKVGDYVLVRDLLQGIIVDSGNDACIAMAEYIAGSQESFVNLMNSQAKSLNMNSTNFTDCTGLPDPRHYTTARDLAILSQALVKNFPKDYQWYKQKWFTYNNIHQPNRNRLLWRYPNADGIKTGHTDDAGFCIVASAEKDNLRLISIILGAPSDEIRTEDSIKLLTYGFRFYESHLIYKAYSPIANTKIWFGKEQTVPSGTNSDLYVATPVGEYQNIKSSIEPQDNLYAPITKGQTVGRINIVLHDQVIASKPLVALENVSKGGFLTRTTNYLFHKVSNLFASKKLT